MHDFQPGDRVLVTDLTLAQLRLVFFEATGEKSPANHHGTVEEIGDDSIEIRFDHSGEIRSYPAVEVRRIFTKPIE
jgi:hypothetical protein